MSQVLLQWNAVTPFLHLVERIEELQQMVESTRNEYKNLKKELELVQAGNLDDQLQEICKRIDELVEYLCISLLFTF